MTIYIVTYILEVLQGRLQNKQQHGQKNTRQMQKNSKIGHCQSKSMLVQFNASPSRVYKNCEKTARLTSYWRWLKISTVTASSSAKTTGAIRWISWGVQSRHRKHALQDRILKIDRRCNSAVRWPGVELSRINPICETWCRLAMRAMFPQVESLGYGWLIRYPRLPLKGASAVCVALRIIRIKPAVSSVLIILHCVTYINTSWTPSIWMNCCLWTNRLNWLSILV